MGYECPNCEASLDPGEKCDCLSETKKSLRLLGNKTQACQINHIYYKGKERICQVWMTQ